MFDDKAKFLRTVMVAMLLLTASGMALPRQYGMSAAAVGVVLLVTGNAMSYLVERIAQWRGHVIVDSNEFTARIKPMPWKAGKNNLVTLTASDKRWLTPLARINQVLVFSGLGFLLVSCGTMIRLTLTNSL